MVRVEYTSPIEDCENRYWWPDYLKDPVIHVEHTARWKKWESPNNHIATYVAFISEEDAEYLLLKYPGIGKDFHKF